MTDRTTTPREITFRIRRFDPEVDTAPHWEEHKLFVPDGMTVLEAYGQMQHANGRIEKQPSRVVVLVHPPGKAADRRIHEIVEAYRDRFQNAQVMLLRSPALVEFFPD